MRPIIRTSKRQTLTSRNSNFDIFLHTHISKKIEYRINEINRAQSNYNKFNVK